MRRAAVLAPLGVVAVLAALAAGCGGSGSSDTPSAETWAGNLCSSISDWGTSIKTATGSLKGNVSKSSVQTALGDVSDATDTFVEDLKGLGTPDTDAGKQAQSALQNLAAELDADSQAIKNAKSSNNGTLATVSAVTDSLSKMSGQIASTFTTLQGLDAKGELSDAFKNASSCKTLAKSSSG